MLNNIIKAENLFTVNFFSASILASDTTYGQQSTKSESAILTIRIYFPIVAYVKTKTQSM